MNSLLCARCLVESGGDDGKFALTVIGGEAVCADHFNEHANA